VVFPDGWLEQNQLTQADFANEAEWRVGAERPESKTLGAGLPAMTCDTVIV
jgi:hypothetical protein